MSCSAQTADLTSHSTKSNRKRKVAEIIVPKKQFHFHGLFRRQNWPFRDSLINYITKNPSNAKAWTKLIQSCKYFFAKNPILVVNKLECESMEWMASLNGFQKRIDFTKISPKLWITEKFDDFNEDNPKKTLSSIIPKIYKCDVKDLHLENYVISYEDFSFLSSNLENIIFYKTIVKNSDGSIVSLEKLIAVLPKIKSIFFYEDSDETSITSNTVKKLLELQHFSTIDTFELFNATEKFDIETFFKYSKKNKHTNFIIGFGNSISETYKKRIEATADKSIETEEHGYIPANIYYV